MLDEWSPSIGDPTALGWLTTLAYLLASGMCLTAGRLTPRRHGRRERLIWFLLATAFVLLGVNKQLDLQAALTESAKVIARAQGWYDTRHGVQRAFILVLGVGVSAASVGLGVVAWRSSNPVRIALAGAVAVLSYVLLRAAFFHHVDGAEDLSVLGPAFELLGIAGVLAGSGLRVRQQRGTRPRS